MQKSFYQMKGDVGMHNAKNHRNKSLHSKIRNSTIMLNLNDVGGGGGGGVTHDCTIILL